MINKTVHRINYATANKNFASQRGSRNNSGIVQEERLRDGAAATVNNLN